MKRLLALLLAIQSAVPAWVLAQQPLTPTPAPAMTIGSLRILVLEGAGATNSTEKHLATPPVVEVRDENDRPVEGATVVFRLPPSGPGAVFPGQALSRTFRTNLQGQVIATGLTPNNQVGAFRIHVTATAGNKMGEADISQINSASGFAAHTVAARGKLPRWWKWAALSGVGVAVVVIIVVAKGGSSKSTVTISPGPVTIGQ